MTPRSPIRPRCIAMQLRASGPPALAPVSSDAIPVAHQAPAPTALSRRSADRLNDTVARTFRDRAECAAGHPVRPHVWHRAPPHRRMFRGRSCPPLTPRPSGAQAWAPPGRSAAPGQPSVRPLGFPATTVRGDRRCAIALRAPTPPTARPVHHRQPRAATDGARRSSVVEQSQRRLLRRRRPRDADCAAPQLRRRRCTPAGSPVRRPVHRRACRSIHSLPTIRMRKRGGLRARSSRIS